MTRAQRFAREWLWLMGCWAVIAVYGIYAARQGRQPTLDHVVEGLLMGVVGCVPLYLVTGAIRLTTWALSQVSQHD